MLQKWIKELPSKTGRSLDEWVRLAKRLGGATIDERRDWLKREHGFGTYNALWIAQRTEKGALGICEDDPDTYLKDTVQYVDEMYAGPKAGLRPIYDKLLEIGLALGDDVKACPCQSIVPLYRNHVFAQLKPTTRTRLDLGLALKDAPFTKRLIDTGGLAKRDRITHRIGIESVKQIDAEVKRWLKKAYELDGK
jgi:hypothetical protein